MARYQILTCLYGHKRFSSFIFSVRFFLPLFAFYLPLDAKYPSLLHELQVTFFPC